jgi:hypothetical protein
VGARRAVDIAAARLPLRPSHRYLTNAASSFRTAASRSAKPIIVYSFSLTSTVLPICAARVGASTPASRDRVA